jgi:hypothetical protein
VGIHDGRWYSTFRFFRLAFTIPTSPNRDTFIVCRRRSLPVLNNPYLHGRTRHPFACHLDCIKRWAKDNHFDIPARSSRRPARRRRHWHRYGRRPGAAIIAGPGSAARIGVIRNLAAEAIPAAPWSARGPCRGRCPLKGLSPKICVYRGLSRRDRHHLAYPAARTQPLLDPVEIDRYVIIRLSVGRLPCHSRASATACLALRRADTGLPPTRAAAL